MTSTLLPEQARRLRVLEEIVPGTLLVHEIYASIQGESTRAGLPCTFIRLTGCHLRCRWCDTPHAFGHGQLMTRDAVLEQVRSLSPVLVEVTGGEPLAQPETPKLLHELADAGYEVLLETSGSLPMDAVDPRVTIIMDLKCPGSGEAEHNHWPNLSLLKPTDEIKFVVADRDDFDWAIKTIDEHDLAGRPLLMAPAFGELPYATLCAWIIETGLPMRFQLQWHKHIWPPHQRGV